jgi:hypothetical protein
VRRIKQPFLTAHNVDSMDYSETLKEVMAVKNIRGMLFEESNGLYYREGVLIGGLREVENYVTSSCNSLQASLVSLTCTVSR